MSVTVNAGSLPAGDYTGKVTITFTNGGTRPHTLFVKNKDGQGDLFRSEEVDTGGTAHTGNITPLSGPPQ